MTLRPLDNNASPKNKLLRLPEVVEITAISKSAIYKMVRDGEFPKPINLGARSVAWVESEVYQAIEKRIQQRDEVAS